MATKTTTTNKTTKSNTKAKTGVKEVKEVANVEVTNKAVTTLLKPDDFVELFSEAGIVCGNPQCKDIYRTMGTKRGGSSLQVRATEGYRIMTTNADFEFVKDLKMSGVTVLANGNLVSKGGKSEVDGTRPHLVKIVDTDTLRAVLKLYTQNPNNVAPKAVEQTA